MATGLDRHFSEEDVWEANKHLEGCPALLVIKEMQIAGDLAQ